jgi:hypothetical protein
VSDQPEAAAPAAPLLRVITPGTTPEEVAAIVAVLAALGGGDATPPPTPARAWNTPRRLHRRTFPSGPGAWRASGLPL